MEISSSAALPMADKFFEPELPRYFDLDHFPLLDCKTPSPRLLPDHLFSGAAGEPFNLSTFQPFNLSTFQPFNLSTCTMLNS